LGASTSGGSTAIAAAVINQTSMNLGNSDVLVQTRDKQSQKTEDATFARILAGTLVPAAHPFKRLIHAIQYDHALFQPGLVYMQIWFYESINQQIEDNFGETLYDSKWQDFLNGMEISFQREYFLAHGWKNTGNKRINGATQALKNPGISTDYWMAEIYVKEFRNQGGVAAYKAASNKTDD